MRYTHLRAIRSLCSSPRVLQAVALLWLGLMTTAATAELNINRASLQELQTLKGIGPKTAQTIIQERQRAGDFSDIEDFAARIKGFGLKRSRKLQAQGVQFGDTSPTQPSIAKPESAQQSTFSPSRIELHNKMLSQGIEQHQKHLQSRLPIHITPKSASIKDQAPYYIKRP